MINPRFDMTPLARRQLCEDALARYLPRSIEAQYQQRIGQTIAVPYFHPAALIVGLWMGLSEWHYRIQATIGETVMTTCRPCTAI